MTENMTTPKQLIKKCSFYSQRNFKFNKQGEMYI